MKRENIYVDVNTVVDVLRDTKALYSILVKYTKDFLDLYELLQNVNPEEFAELFNNILDEVKYEIKLYKSQNKDKNTKLSSIEFKETIYRTLLERKDYPDPRLMKLTVYSAVDFIKAKSNYYRSSKTKVYIEDVSRGSILATLSAVGATVPFLCAAAMAIAYLSQRNGKNVEVECNLYRVYRVRLKIR